MPRTQRINREDLEKIMDGGVAEKHSVMIKFYSQTCFMCHALAPIYMRISDKHEDVLFYVYNMLEDAAGEIIEAKYGLDGVPSLCLVRTDGEHTKIKMMPNPQEPDKETWYYEDDIDDFIERYKHTQSERS